MSASAQTTVVAFGDSIAAGLGARGRAFPRVLAERLGAELDDRSLSATKVSRSLELAVADPPVADVALVMHGVSEALPRVPEHLLARLPRRWRGAGRLDPRPYFSSDPRKRMIQRADSWARTRTKVSLMRLAGTERWMTLPEYRRDLGLLLEALDGCGQVVVLGPTPIDDRGFPGASRALAEYAAVTRAVAADAGATFIALDAVLDRWDDLLADHFHPTASGHAKIAERVLEAVGRATVPRAG